MFKKLTLFFAALTLSAGLWAESVEFLKPVYVDDDVTKGIDMWQISVKEATPITSSSSTWGTAGQETWFVVNENVTISQRVECLGDVRLILANGVTLTAQQGITASVSRSLTIYAQTEDLTQMGQLIATGGNMAAGIGGGNSNPGSNITINGGKVIAKGGEAFAAGAAGIGGGNMCNGSDITINGGKVEATGGQWAAGIGGGCAASGSNIIINGGIVIAKGGERGPVDAAAGIGGGSYGGGSNITINGGTVKATSDGADGIGAGMGYSASDIFVATSLVVKADNTNPPTTVITNTGADLASSLAGKQYATIEPVLPISTSYIDENGVEQNIDAWEVKDASEAVTWGTDGETTWYVVNGTNVQLAKGAICAGDVRLILANNAKLTTTGASGSAGIQVSGEGNSLTIYAQSTGEQMGQLFANGGAEAAGIGGREWRSGSNITINGGIITATGGNNGAAGIGGGNGDAGSNIIINGGEVTATGGDYAAGIGGGMQGSGSNITINGGEVEATGGQWAAGIGGGSSKSGSNITINGGTVEATGGDGGAGIGGGMQGSGSNITINGGEVEATGGGDGAGIGGGGDGDGSNITINGGIVEATGDGAAGIGGGYGGNGSDIYISDAYVLKAGGDADDTEVIAHSSAQDLGETLTQQYVKIEGLATPYTRSMTIDNWATVCLPYAATGFSGANFYRVNYYDGDTKLYIEEVSSLVAGQPYIFQATAETVTIEHAGVATLTYGEEQKDRGLQGLFARTIIATDGSQAALSNNAVQWLESGLEITVPACRAYFDMNNVPREEQPHSSAPLRCIRVPRQTPTDFENVTLDEDATKILRNGQLIIIRDGKEYNAQGMQL